MKKKFETVKRGSVVLVTLMSSLLFWQSGWHACAKENVQAPPDSLMRTFELTSDETAQVPRCIVEEGVVYVLDEASITVEVSGSSSAEGADVVTFTRKVGDLSDNDLSRIEKEAVFEGIPCELLSVSYKVEEETESGIPVCYSAVCMYGGLKKYSTSYPAAWRMTARYDLSELMTETEIVEIREETEEGDTWPERRSGGKESGADETVKKEEDTVPKAVRRGFRIKPESEKEHKERIPDLPIPLVAAAAAGAGLTLPFIIWITVLTAPLYGLNGKRKYRYIGRIRLKKEMDIYAAYLTKRLCARAELPVFQIRLPKRVRRKAKVGMLRVDCPEGKRIMTTMGRIVCFTVEGD